MDFLFSLFGPATAKTHAELDSEIEQVLVDFEGVAAMTEAASSPKIRNQR